MSDNKKNNNSNNNNNSQNKKNHKRRVSWRKHARVMLNDGLCNPRNLHEKGMDGDYHVHNIARDTYVNRVLMKKSERKDFKWVACCLQQKGPELPRLKMMDTVVCENGVPLHYFYTDKEGILRKKGKKYLQNDKIRDEFMKISMEDSKINSTNKSGVGDVNFLNNSNSTTMENGGNSNSNSNADTTTAANTNTSNDEIYACTVIYPSGFQIVSIKAFDQMMKSVVPNDCVAIQPFRCPKGTDPNRVVNYAHEYLLDKFTQINDRCVRLNVGSEIQGTKNTDERILSMNTVVNNLMTQQARQIVYHIEQAHRCRVVKLTTEYVVDAMDNVFFVRSGECLVTPYEKVNTRGKSPEAYRLIREAHNSEIHEVLDISSGDDFTYERFDKIVKKSKEGNSSVPGKKSDARISHRRVKENVVDEDEIAKIMNKDFDLTKISRKNRKKKIMREKEDALATEYSNDDMSQNESSTDEKEARERGVSERRASQTGTLATATDMTSLQRPLTPPKALTTVELREIYRSFAAHEALGSSQVNGCKGDFCSYDVTINSIDGQKMVVSNMSDFKKKMLATEGDFEENQTTDDKEGRLAKVKLPFRQIVNARKEAKYVNLMLKRHKKGQEEDYLATKDVDGFNLGNEYPGLYYEDVKVCDSCYKVYGLIEARRNKALNKYDPLPETPRRKIYAKEIEAQEDDTIETKALIRAQYFIDSLSRNHCLEFRTYKKNPPMAVTMVSSALMILLKGAPLSWEAARRWMANGDRFLNAMYDFDPESITQSQLQQIEGYIKNENFRPNIIEGVSKSAANICGWILGMVQTKIWTSGNGHERVDPLATKENNEAVALAVLKQETNPKPKPKKKGNTLTFAEKLEMRRNELSDAMKRAGGGERTKEPDRIPRTWENIHKERATRKERKGRYKDGPRDQTEYNERVWDFIDGRSPEEVGARSKSPEKRNHMGSSDEEGFSSNEEGGGTSKKARFLAQQKQMARLHSKHEGPGVATITSTVSLSDGFTKVPYTVMGKLLLEVSRCNFVILHDIFDTYEKTNLTFKSLTAKHVGCQTLTFNYPGQAGTVFNMEKSSMNNEYIADVLHEVLLHCEQSGEFMIGHPFHLVGIGNGASIATAFLKKYGTTPRYRNAVRSLVSVNGFASVDAQLAAILHSSINVFSTLPEDRPDLPISFFSRFLFSEEYLKQIHPNLALNIYTAVGNTITLPGRMKLCRGALSHKDLTKELQNINVPVVLLQSTENMLVNAANVDPFIEGRSALHLWSHQISPDAPKDANSLGKRGCESLLQSLSKQKGAFVVWVNSGHEVIQEQKRTMSDLFDALAYPNAEYLKVDPSFGKQIQLKLVPGDDFIEKGLREKKKTKEEKAKVFDNIEDKPKLKEFLPKKVEEPPVPPMLTTEDSQKMVNISTEKAVQEENLFEKTNIDESLSSTFDLVTPNITEAEKDMTIEDMLKESEKTDLEFRNAVSGHKQQLVEGTTTNKVISSNDYQNKDLQASPSSSNAPSKPKQLQEEEGAERPATPTTPVALYTENDGIPKQIFFATNDDLSSAKEQNASGMDETQTLFTDSHTYDISVNNTNASENSPESSKKPEDSTLYTDNNSYQVSVQQPTDGALNSLASHSIENRPSTNSISPQQSQIAIESTQYTDDHSYEVSVDQQRRDADLISLHQENSVISELANEPPSASQISDTKTEASESKVEIDVLSLPSKFIEPKLESSPKQRKDQQWADEIVSLDEIIDMEKKNNNFTDEQEKKLLQKKEENEKELQDRLARFEQQQAERRKKYEDEDKALLEELDMEVMQRKKVRAEYEMERRVMVDELESKLMDEGIIGEYKPPEGEAPPVKEMKPIEYQEIGGVPGFITADKPDYLDPKKLFDELDSQAENAKELGLTTEQMARVQEKQQQDQMAKAVVEKTFNAEEHEEIYEDAVVHMQRLGRGFLGRCKADKQKILMKKLKDEAKAATKIQALARMKQANKKVERIKREEIQELVLGQSALTCQRVYRGYVGRMIFLKRLHTVKSLLIQRVYRGHLGREVARRERERLKVLRLKALAAVKIQSTWRMKVVREEYKILRVNMLAAMEVQRVYRGHLGRKKATRRKTWENAEPGPERLKQGLMMIEESKLAFERQREEIDALHRAQEKAESRVSHVYAELRESEKELRVLEKELQEVDQIERDLQELTHEREMLNHEISGAVGVLRTGEPMEHDDNGVPYSSGAQIMPDNPDPNQNRPPNAKAGIVDTKELQAESYALEMAIHLKRAEREKKKQELEAEFATVFQEVERKKLALERLEVALDDMEATRIRKDREFARLQRNLMELLHEQKYELDALREKGIELETATATSAAAATATAQRAQEHEKRSSAMFEQTEELMKFQFMSMSLSYFSSLNMLKQMREMNADTTTAAIASSADAAASAAAAAAAANIPSIRHFQLDAEDVIEASLKHKREQLDAARKAEETAKQSRLEPFPEDVRLWSVEDVGRWLDTLHLNQYRVAFKEAVVDGDFLMELREEDLMQVLGMEHRLHVRKLLISRDKLKPLSQQEQQMKEFVVNEQQSAEARGEQGVPDLEVAFSQCRNGRQKRLEESLNLGFNINKEDEKGNTLLIVACQNCNKKMVEMLLRRGSAVNHKNAAGNTALHFAMAYDPEGLLGEFLIEKGADDMLENVEGLTCYDGLGSNQ